MVVITKKRYIHECRYFSGLGMIGLHLGVWLRV